MMKIHRFECENKHEFFIPLHLPLDMTVMVGILKKMECPLCHSKSIVMDAREYMVLTDLPNRTENK